MSALANLPVWTPQRTQHRSSLSTTLAFLKRHARGTREEALLPFRHLNNVLLYDTIINWYKIFGLTTRTATGGESSRITKALGHSCSIVSRSIETVSSGTSRRSWTSGTSGLCTSALTTNMRRGLNSRSSMSVPSPYMTTSAASTGRDVLQLARVDAGVRASSSNQVLESTANHAALTPNPAVEAKPNGKPVCPVCPYHPGGGHGCLAVGPAIPRTLGRARTFGFADTAQ
ncbi:hypothetical protein DFR41_11410 [Pseudacidovorax intermedius]|uniref:Uncharacterized protein n=1 Tax=Pseudacidovorax intermedius TaxID=433924 RepID=A0A370F680_9BURK|nr:hypothetical protein DFR41_11410 [Pseudacidovorax intermedius]